MTPSLTYYSGTSATGTALSGAPTAVGTYTVLASFAGSTDYTSGAASTTFTISSGHAQRERDRQRRDVQQRGLHGHGHGGRSGSQSPPAASLEGVTPS